MFATRPTLDITLKIQRASPVTSSWHKWMAGVLLWTHHSFGAKWKAWWSTFFAEELLVPQVMINP
jgi:ABC-type thiamine transport system substrate-binding protein